MFQESASVSGNQSLTVGAGGTVTFDKSLTIAGSLVIGGTMTLGSASHTITVNATLTLESTGVLDNPGTVRARAFVNNGGTILGNAPVLVVGGAMWIADIILAGANRERTVQAAADPTGPVQVILICQIPSEGRFEIQTSSNLTDWIAIPAVMEETGPGQVRATVALNGEMPQFFRLLRKP